MRVFYVIYVSDPLLEGILDGVRFLANPHEKGRAHVTVRGPYRQRYDLTAQQRRIAGTRLTCHGAGSFFGPRQNTVFVRCDSPALRDVWHKPDYGYHPHLTLYDGSSRVVAEDLLTLLEAADARFGFEVVGLEPLLSTKGQANLDLAAAWALARPLLQERLGADLPQADAVRRLEWPARRDLVGARWGALPRDEEADVALDS